MENDFNQTALDELIKAMQYLIDQTMGNTTKVYDGLVKSDAGNGRWNIEVNKKIHALKAYGSITPAVNMMVKVIVPEGNFSKAFFF